MQISDYETDNLMMSRHWHLDKKVPILLILTIFLQTGGFFWWAATTSEKVTALKERTDATAPQAERLARVEVSLDDIKVSLVEIKQSLKDRR